MNDWTKQKRDRGGKWFVYPDDASANMIKALCSSFMDSEDLDDKLHVTLAHDKNNPLSCVRVHPPTRQFHAEIVGTEMFGPNNDILVLVLNSPELKLEHERIHSDGAVFDFNPYVPHITIKYGAKQSERDHLESIMVNPLRPPILIRFHKQARFMVEPKSK